MSGPQAPGGVRVRPRTDRDDADVRSVLVGSWGGRDVVTLDAVEQARRLEPSIPLLGDGGVPIVDELELELRL